MELNSSLSTGRGGYTSIGFVFWTRENVDRGRNFAFWSTLTAIGANSKISNFASVSEIAPRQKRNRSFLVTGIEDEDYEENVSAESPPSEEDAWVSNPHAFEGGPGGALASSAQGPTSSSSVSSLGAGVAPDERIRQRREFQRAYDEGRRVVCRYFVAFVVPRSSGPLRLGVVASRRVGNAVIRNRAKRLLREVFRNRRPGREVSADVVLVARGAIKSAGYEAVESAYVRNVGKLLEKIP